MGWTGLHLADPRLGQKQKYLEFGASTFEVTSCGAQVAALEEELVKAKQAKEELRKLVDSERQQIQARLGQGDGAGLSGAATGLLIAADLADSLQARRARREWVLIL